MSATLTGLRERLCGLLADGSTSAWSTTALDEALRAALGEYGLASGQPATLSGLDGAAATSLPEHHESLLAWGAAGFAAVARAVQRAGLHDPQLSASLRAWGEGRLQEYRAGLRAVFPNGPAVTAIRASTYPTWGEWSEEV